MGCQRDNFLTATEQVIPGNPASPQQSKILLTVPSQVCEGQMNFIKRNIGDGATIFIEVAGRKPSSSSYFAVLSDSVPVFTEEGVIVGDISAVSDTGAAVMSVTISFSVKPRG